MGVMNIEPWKERILNGEPQSATLARMELLLTMQCEGRSNADICAALGVDNTRLWQLRNHSAFKKMWSQFLEETRSETKDEFIRRSKAAGQRIELLANQQANLRVALSANQDILDRAGFRPKQEVENTYVLRIERGTLDTISAAARESGVLGAGRAPRILEAYGKVEPILPDEGDPRQAEIDWPPPPTDGGLCPDARPENPDARSSRSLQDDHRIRGLPDLAPHRQQ